MLTVIEKTDQKKDNSIIWKCQCDCGGDNSIVYVAGNQLTSGRVKSCGCLAHKSKFRDLTGMTFGRWKVLYFAGKDKKRQVKWHCQCSCENHTERDICAGQLINGTSQSCGCLQKEIASKIGKNAAYDLTGKTFGKLTVKYRVEDNNGPMWLCECSCDNHTEIIVSSQNLLRGKKISCGCIGNSYGEYLIEEILNNENVKYVKNYIFNDCKFPDTNYHGRFDFYVENSYIIEFDGQQHFRPKNFGGITWKEAYKLFNKTRYNDLFKTYYCFENNIPIIRIPYTHIKEIIFDDL